MRRCYIPCDENICPGVPRHADKYLWEAQIDNVQLCYSYENCGGVNHWTNGTEQKCIDRGGNFIDGGCTCDVDPDKCHKGHVDSNQIPWNAIGGAVAAVVLIAIVAIAVVIYCHCRAKDKREKDGGEVVPVKETSVLSIIETSGECFAQLLITIPFLRSLSLTC